MYISGQMQANRERRSSGKTRNAMHRLQEVMPLFLSKEFICSNSLFANLYSSETFKLEIEDNQFMSTVFSKPSLCENELHQINYFSVRDKKCILFHSILLFLLHAGKAELLIMENSSRTNRRQLREYLLQHGTPKILEECEKRVVWQFALTPLAFKFNLQYLPLHLKEREFIKCVIISDINSFDTNEKASFDKLYRKVPRELAIVAFRQDFYDYKLILKTSSSYTEEGADEVYELNERASNLLSRKYESHPKSSVSLLVPIECIGIANKSMQETERMALIRKNHRNGRYSEFTMCSPPFKLLTYREI